MGGIRRFIQILGALLCALAALAAGSILFPIPYVSDFVKQQVITNYNISIVVVVLLALLAFVFLLMLFHAMFSPAKSSRLVLANEIGDIIIKREIVEATAYDAIHDIPDVRHPNVHVKLGNDVRQTKVKVDFDIYETADVTQAGNAVQRQIKEDVDRLFGEGIPEVSVNVNQLNPEVAEQAKQTTNRPRVR